MITATGTKKKSESDIQLLIKKKTGGIAFAKISFFVNCAAASSINANPYMIAAMIINAFVASTFSRYRAKKSVSVVVTKLG